MAKIARVRRTSAVQWRVVVLPFEVCVPNTKNIPRDMARGQFNDLLAHRVATVAALAGVPRKSNEEKPTEAYEGPGENTGVAGRTTPQILERELERRKHVVDTSPPLHPSIAPFVNPRDPQPHHYARQMRDVLNQRPSLAGTVHMPLVHTMFVTSNEHSGNTCPRSSHGKAPGHSISALA